MPLSSEGDAGWVKFRAILTQAGGDVSFEERSTFVRRAGRWLYFGGAVHAPASIERDLAQAFRAFTLRRSLALVGVRRDPGGGRKE